MSALSDSTTSTDSPRPTLSPGCFSHSTILPSVMVEQGQLESTCELAVGDNLVRKMQVSIVVRDGVVQAIEEA